MPAFLGLAALPGPDGGVVLRATVAKDAPLGLQTGQLRVRTNVAVQPELVVPYRLGIFDDVVPEASSVDLGSVRQGRPFAKSLRHCAAARAARRRRGRRTAPVRCRASMVGMRGTGPVLPAVSSWRERAGPRRPVCPAPCRCGSATAAR